MPILPIAAAPPSLAAAPSLFVGQTFLLHALAHVWAPNGQHVGWQTPAALHTQMEVLVGPGITLAAAHSGLMVEQAMFAAGGGFRTRPDVMSWIISTAAAAHPS